MDKTIDLHVGTRLWDYRNGGAGIVNTVAQPAETVDLLFKLYPLGSNPSDGRDLIELITMFGFLPIEGQGSIDTGSTYDADGTGASKGIMFLRIFLEPHNSINPGDTAYSLIFEFLSWNLQASTQVELESTKNYITLDSNCFGYPDFPTQAFPSFIDCNDSPISEIYKKYMSHSGLLDSLTDSYDIENAVGRSRWMDKNIMGLVYQSHLSNPELSNILYQMNRGDYVNIHPKYKIEPSYNGLNFICPLYQNYSILKMLENSLMQPTNITAQNIFSNTPQLLTIKLNPKNINGIKKYSILSIKSGGFSDPTEMIPEMFPTRQNNGAWWDSSIGISCRVANQVTQNIVGIVDSSNTNIPIPLGYITGGPIATQYGLYHGEGSSALTRFYCPTGLYFSNNINNNYGDGEKYRFLLTPSQFCLGMGYDIYCADEAIKFEMLPDETKTVHFLGIENLSLTGTWKRFRLIRAGETPKTTTQLGQFD